MNLQQLIAALKWLGLNVGLVGSVMLLAGLGHSLCVHVLLRLAKRTRSPNDELVITRCLAPSRWIVILAAIWLVLDLTSFPLEITIFLRRVISVTLMVLTVWLLLRILRAGCDIFLTRYNMTVPDNLRARAMHTQVKVLERIGTAVIVVIGFGCILMTFDGIRQLGVSLLASAGIAGIILGLAAQRVLGTLLAGLQLAITQPIRLEDVVIVEGEWGVIEEITLSYVVVRIWDRRRLIVPMTYFMEKPFQNWTRTSADLLGTVFLYADPAAPVEPIRNELHRLLKESPEWDGQVWNLQVTNVTDRSMELRALMGARNASEAWNLRCRIREQLLAFIREHQSGALPRLRIEEPREAVNEGLLATGAAGSA